MIRRKGERDLANQIVRRLFTNASGVRAECLVLRGLQDSQGRTISLSESDTAARIVSVLDESGCLPIPDYQDLLRGAQIARMLGYSYSVFHHRIRREPSFPRAVRVLPNSAPQWRRSEVLEWIEQRPRIDAAAESA